MSVRKKNGRRVCMEVPSVPFTSCRRLVWTVGTRPIRSVPCHFVILSEGIVNNLKGHEGTDRKGRTWRKTRRWGKGRKSEKNSRLHLSYRRRSMRFIHSFHSCERSDRRERQGTREEWEWTTPRVGSLQFHSIPIFIHERSRPVVHSDASVTDAPYE